jgi:predicted nucleic acid-binding protein
LLADTTFIIDIMKQDADAMQTAEELSEASISILVGTPTIFELYAGVGLSVRSSEEKEKVLTVLKSLPHLALDAASASKAGSIYAQRIREGSKIDPEDAMLAGIALQNNEPLLTRNRKDFTGIADLKLEHYSAASNPHHFGDSATTMVDD